MRAWIETNEYIWDSKGLTVARRVRAWIETSSNFDKINLKLSHAVCVRGLKQKIDVSL